MQRFYYYELFIISKVKEELKRQKERNNKEDTIELSRRLDDLSQRARAWIESSKNLYKDEKCIAILHYIDGLSWKDALIATKSLSLSESGIRKTIERALSAE